MKRSLIISAISAIAIGVFCLVRKYLGAEEEKQAGTRPRKHLTDVFSRAKQHAAGSME